MTKPANSLPADLIARVAKTLRTTAEDVLESTLTQLDTRLRNRLNMAEGISNQIARLVDEVNDVPRPR